MALRTRHRVCRYRKRPPEREPRGGTTACGEAGSTGMHARLSIPSTHIAAPTRSGAILTVSCPRHAMLGAMDTEDWCGLVVRTGAGLRFGAAVGVVTDGRGAEASGCRWKRWRHALPG
jgi:hypothetical protein